MDWALPPPRAFQQPALQEGLSHALRFTNEQLPTVCSWVGAGKSRKAGVGVCTFLGSVASLKRQAEAEEQLDCQPVVPSPELVFI